MKLEDKIMRAAKKYLAFTGCKIINENFMNEDVFVIQDDDGVAFVDVFIFGEDDEHMKRDYFEHLIFRFFAQEHEVCDVPVRYDILEFHVISGSRAIIKHYINAGLED